MTRKGKITAAILAVVAAVILVRAVADALTPEATRIRRLLVSMADGFDRARAAPCVRGLASEFRDGPSGLSRAEIQGLLVEYFFHESDPETGKPPYRVELPREAMAITVDPEGERAEASFTAVFFPRDEDADEPDPVWEFRVRAWLAKRKDGWRIERAERETIRGEMPFGG